MLSVPGIIDPVLVQWGPLKVHWYSMAYILPILYTRYRMKQPLSVLIERSQRKQDIQKQHSNYGEITITKNNDNRIHQKPAEDFFDWYILIAIVAGGRLGYVVLYQTSWFWTDPLHILRIWDGGMSFHGGVCGFALACVAFARKHQLNMWKLSDMLMPFVPIGLGLGRLANFINGELPGRVSKQIWAVQFSRLDALPRHPSPIYEFLLEGMILFFILHFLKKSNYSAHSGFLTAMFLILYGFFRIIAECFREPDLHIGFIMERFTLGQLYSIPMIVSGIIILVVNCHSRQNVLKRV